MESNWLPDSIFCSPNLSENIRRIAGMNDEPPVRNMRSTAAAPICAYASA